jgi:hypothetical protein
LTWIVYGLIVAIDPRAAGVEFLSVIGAPSMSATAELLEMRRMSVKIDAEILKKAKMVAADREVSVIEYLEAMINPIVQQDLEEVLKKLTGRRRPKGDE